MSKVDERSGALLGACYAEIMPDRPPCCRMNLETAELTKIAVNTYATTKITFANMLAGPCERIPGGDVDVVTRALGHDRRIGPQYLTGALGDGGPCLRRDNLALGFPARALGAPTDLAVATDRANRDMILALVERISRLVPPGTMVACSAWPISHSRRRWRSPRDWRWRGR